MGNIKKVRDHWPWKVKKIFLFPNEPKEIIPKEKKFTSGKETFLNHCIACHSLNGIGGTKGGELSGLIQSTTLTDKTLLKFIQNPRNVREDSQMPDFPHYLDNKKNRIIKLLEYIKHQISELSPRK